MFTVLAVTIVVLRPSPSVNRSPFPARVQGGPGGLRQERPRGGGAGRAAQRDRRGAARRLRGVPARAVPLAFCSPLRGLFGFCFPFGFGFPFKFGA